MYSKSAACHTWRVASVLICLRLFCRQAFPNPSQHYYPQSARVLHLVSEVSKVLTALHVCYVLVGHSALLTR